jgi:hypothetical protein
MFMSPVPEVLHPYVLEGGRQRLLSAVAASEASGSVRYSSPGAEDIRQFKAIIG